MSLRWQKEFGDPLTAQRAPVSKEYDAAPALGDWFFDVRAFQQPPPPLVYAALLITHHAIDHHQIDARRDSARIAVSRDVLDRRHIDQHDISERPFPHHAAILQPKTRGRQPRHFAHGLGKFEQL